MERHYTEGGVATVAQAHSPIIVPVLLQGRSTIELSAYSIALADTASYLPSARIIVLPNDSIHRYGKSNISPSTVCPGATSAALAVEIGNLAGRGMAQVALQLLR